MKQLPKHIIFFLITMIGIGCSSDQNTYTYEHYRDKIDKKEININVLGGTLDSSNAEMKLKIEYTGKNKFQFTIPAGTLFTSNDMNMQNMMSARDVLVIFPGGSINQVQNITIESYCINYFLDPPTLDPALPSSYRSDLKDVRYSTIVSGDAIWELNQCLEKKSDSHSVRQMAIWMVSDGLMDMSREEVANKLAEHYSENVHKALEGLRHDLPIEGVESLSDEELIKTIEELIPPDSLKAYGINTDVLHPGNIARTKVDEFFQKAGPLLRDCGINTDTKRFFQN